MFLGMLSFPTFQKAYIYVYLIPHQMSNTESL